MYNKNLEMGQPFYDVGVSGVNRLRDLMGLGENQDPAFIQQQLEADPSYKFRLSKGQQAIDRAMSAQGKTLDPEYVKALGEYNQGFASQEAGNLFDRLARISGMGQAQSAGQAALGQDYASNVGNIQTSLAESLYGARSADKARRSQFAGNVLGSIAGGGFF